MPEQAKTETDKTAPGQETGGIGNFVEKNKFSLIGLLIGLVAAIFNPILGLALGAAGMLGGGLMGDKGGKGEDGGLIAQGLNWAQEKIKGPEKGPVQKVAEGAAKLGIGTVEGVLATGMTIKAGKYVAATKTASKLMKPVLWLKDTFMEGLKPITWTAGKLRGLGGPLATAGRTAMAWATGVAPSVTEGVIAAGSATIATGTAVAEAIPLAGAAAVAGTGVAVAGAILSPFAISNAIKWNDVDNTFQPDMNKFSNIVGAQARVHKHMEKFGGVAEPDGKFSLLNPATAQRNLDALQASIQFEKESASRAMQENKPAWYSRIFSFSDAESAKRTAYENKRIDLRQMESAEAELRPYVENMYAYAEAHRDEVRRMAAAAEQAKNVASDRPIQTIANKDEVIVPQTPAKPKTPLKQATVVASASGDALPLKQATVSTSKS